MHSRGKEEHFMVSDCDNVVLWLNLNITNIINVFIANIKLKDIIFFLFIYFGLIFPIFFGDFPSNVWFLHYFFHITKKILNYLFFKFIYLFFFNKNNI